ncbi:hypothetical protein C7460_104189 [Marinoscillum furvescens DSM 4134]|uniref:Uncharacterized protein n=1 Tax=Marinoscillum furvescens DSM 4134 TaxID=1122208 RepID=A0A3D9L5I4_MARFU|nr:hypothetical protein C7460_104189 [Marinoscillum furvescens DSM 4134]
MRSKQAFSIPNQESFFISQPRILDAKVAMRFSALCQYSVSGVFGSLDGRHFSISYFFALNTSPDKQQESLQKGLSPTNYTKLKNLLRGNCTEAIYGLAYGAMSFQQFFGLSL